jgi:hypothetical protein
MNECTCDCHKIEGMKHIQPCCMTCSVCKRNIKIEAFDEHLIDCVEFYTRILKKVSSSDSAEV